tara:strand:- start:110 stop:1006 length:897 start_codon:yes stop_codon:yes gene_type:complete
VNSLINLTLPEAVSEESLAAFVQIIPFETLSFSSKRADGAFSGAWQILWVVEGAPALDAIHRGINSALNIMQLDSVTANDLEIKPLDEDINWLEVSYQGFAPFSAGRFFIHGAHFEGGCPEGQIPLEIDASIAFGSGEHGTTHGCLLLLEKLYGQGFAPNHVLDMGCGSGILAVGAAKLWPVPTMAVDIEDDAEVLTDQHAKSNGVAAHISTYVGDGYKCPAVAKSDAFDLIIANILPAPLKAMAPDMYPCLAKNGYLILSGILHEQADDVIAVHSALGLTLQDHIKIGDWTSLLYSK